MSIVNIITRNQCLELVGGLIFATLFASKVVFALSLKQVEHAAVIQSPEIKAQRAKSQALAQTAIAQGQLMDPKLMVGAMNLPVDTFDLRQEPMTQIKVGLSQMFPKGKSLQFRESRSQYLSTSHMQMMRDMELKVLKGVRHAWLNLYLSLQTKKIILKQKKVFQHLLSVTESLLANNKAQQKDVIRAQLELNQTDNQLIEIDEKIAASYAQLERWVGNRLSRKSHPARLPHWPLPPTLTSLVHQVTRHPNIMSRNALIDAAKSKVKLTEQDYKPGLAISTAYGVRQGKNMNGSQRVDFVSAQVNMDLPLFIRNRQDRRLKSSEYELTNQYESRQSQLRHLRQSLKEEHAKWQHYKQSVALYNRHLLPEAKQYAQATMTAYQNNQTDFPTLARAYTREFNTELGGLKARVNHAKARVALLYLQGR